MIFPTYKTEAGERVRHTNRVSREARRSDPAFALSIPTAPH
jgi:hypothetical protein